MDYFEDMAVGDTMEFGSHTVTREEILDFAEQFDPQPFHVDEEAAERSQFGGLIASGWHTASLCMRMLVDNHLSEAASAGARGVRELKWIRPVRPGDTLTCRLEVLDTDPGDGPIGTVHNQLTGLVDGEPVIRWKADAMFEKREA
ncbi:MaoC family dehydratase [Halosegnis marinus]|uniref:MaoC family dehydratase n=1 Tax=Halosegnis marinus TaxID=3034023 RepID=A0ABD5ZS98_9EURY|nr:MaoC family dehydratase [Halosegnis sp. DT85]